MRAHLVTLRNPYDPLADREVRTLRRRCRISRLARASKIDPRQPYLCLVNGQPLARAHWRRRCRDGDVVAFVVLPQNKGGSNPLALVLQLAVLAIAGPLAGGLVGSTTGFAFNLVRGIIGIAGAALVSALLDRPRGPSTQAAADMAAPSPTYSIGAQGNNARLGAPIPEAFGRNRLWPDFAAVPYAEYAGNEQYVYSLLCVGRGQYLIERIQLEDSLIQDAPVASGINAATGVFPEVSYEIVQPGGLVTLFPANVVTSVEVTGQELNTGVAVGPFVVNAAGTTVNAIAVDVACRRGLYFANDNGTLDARTVNWTVEARAIDNAGAPAGGWINIGTRSHTAATNTAQRLSYRADVTAGRYEVRLTRTDAKDTSSRAGHDLTWEGLRGYLPGAQSYGDCTMLALRMRATNSLSEASSRRVNVIATRKVPIWDGTSWSAPTATRNPAWAIAQACRTSGLTDGQIDLAALLAVSATWAARGDTFDHVFDNRITLMEAIGLIARAGRATRFIQGGVVRVVRDQAQSVPVQIFSMRNIVAGSFKREYLLPSDDEADCVEIEFWDEETFAPGYVTCALPGSAASRPAKVKLAGASTRAHAYREGMFIAADAAKRRTRLNFQVEQEGFIVARGDYCGFTYDRPQWGHGCDVVSVTGLNGSGGIDVGGVIEIEEPYTWVVGQTHYIGFRRRDGSFIGPRRVTQGASDRHLVLAQAVVGFQPYTGADSERTVALFGPGTQQFLPIRVLEVRPRGDLVEISAANEDPSVHTADGGTPPAPGAGLQLPVVPDAPVIPGALIVNAAGTPASPSAHLNWPPAAGATHYVVEHSLDGDSWTRVAEPVAPTHYLHVPAGAQSFRVAGQGRVLGPFRSWSGTIAGDLVAPVMPPTITGLVAVGVKFAVLLTWAQPSAAQAQWYQIARSTVNDINTAGVIDTFPVGPAPLYVDTVGASAATYYYWVRLVSKAGAPGFWSASAGSTTGQIALADMGNGSVGAAQLLAGSVVAGKIAANTLTVGDAVMANAYVDTLKIAGEAVTVPVSGYAPGPLVSFPEWVAIANIIATGRPIIINVCASYQAAANTTNTISFYLYRDATIVWQGQVTHGNGETGVISASSQDTPSAGFHGYGLYVVGDALNVSQRSISLIEAKR
jgi:hypothetical protein